MYLARALVEAAVGKDKALELWKKLAEGCIIELPNRVIIGRNYGDERWTNDFVVRNGEYMVRIHDNPNRQHYSRGSGCWVVLAMFCRKWPTSDTHYREEKTSVKEKRPIVGCVMFGG